MQISRVLVDMYLVHALYIILMAVHERSMQISFTLTVNSFDLLKSPSGVLSRLITLVSSSPASL